MTRSAYHYLEEWLKRALPVPAANAWSVGEFSATITTFVTADASEKRLHEAELDFFNKYPDAPINFNIVVQR